MTRFALVLSLLLLAGAAAHAGPMTLADTVMNTANNASDPTPTSWFLPPAVSPGYTPPWYRYINEDWGWDHAVTYLPDPSPDSSGVFSFVSGSLTVHAWGVDDPDQIYADGVLLGALQQQPAGLGEDWTTTTFILSPAFLQSHLADGVLNVWMDIDTASTGEGLILDWAHLIVDYQWDWVEGPAVVPAPAGAVLAGIGTGLLGLLRRRRYI